MLVGGFSNPEGEKKVIYYDIFLLHFIQNNGGYNAFKGI